MEEHLSWERGAWDVDSVVPWGFKEGLFWQQWQQLIWRKLTSLILTRFLKLQYRDLNSANVF